jgi:hypothetical protein
MPSGSRSSPPPPPPKKKHGHAGRGGREIAFDVAAIDAALAPVVPDRRDRAFVLRCVVGEGPRHHRGASWALLRMLTGVLEHLEPIQPDADELADESIAIRLPPALESASDDAAFPVGMPTRLLRELLDDDELAIALASLTDGPAHHALANAVMATLIERIDRRVRKVLSKA